MDESDKIPYLLLFLLALVVNFSGINVGFFTDDQGLYASIAKNMVAHHSFFELFTYNIDWLDKPHFPFWAILLSFKLFGISTWAYRLPALIFFFAGLFYTYLFARKFYGWETAAIAVLILMTALHIMLSNTDVRAEPYLMALMIGSLYHITCLNDRFSWKDLLLAALLTACAVMTKGVFVVIAIYGGLIGQLLFTKQFKSIFQLKWLGLVLFTMVFTLPEFYALYIQFDLHPEKTVFGMHGVSGIRWFLWDSQFGRFLNNGPINRKAQGSLFFYLHTLLWAFAPWCLMFYYAVYKNIKGLFQRKELQEYFTLTGGLLLLLLFSLSGFQLPFYTNVVFPFFAIITAPFFHLQLTKFGTKLRMIGQWIFVFLLPFAVVLLNFYLKPRHGLFFAADCVFLGVLIFIIPIQIKAPRKKLFFLNCATALFAGFYLNTIFYNEITPYKGQIAAAQYINQKQFAQFPVFTLSAENNIFQFYCNKPVGIIGPDQFNTFKCKTPTFFYVTQQGLDKLTQQNAHFKVIRSFVNYPQENILPKFINKITRYQALDHVYLVSRSQ